MPLHIDAIPDGLTKGELLRWIVDPGEVKRPQVGSIQIRGRHAIIDLPEAAGQRLARLLDGQPLLGRSVQAWFETASSGGNADDHFLRLARWLEMDAQAELEQTAQWRQAGGNSDSSTRLTDLIGRDEDTGLGGYTLLTLGRRNLRQPLPATELRVGSPVQVAEQDPHAPERRRGVVTRLEKDHIEVAIQKPFNTRPDRPLFSIDAADDETALQRARAALAKARHARGDRLSELRAILLGQRDPEFRNPPAIDFLDPHLNDSQREAIAFALSASDVAIIHGPPGTGKTTTLAELIRQAVRHGHKVLACAPSNLGVDNLFERLVASGENAVRIGHMARVLPHLREHTLKALASNHRDTKRIKNLRVEANSLFRKAERSASASMDREAQRTLSDEARSLWDEARAVENGIVESILNQADILCATNTGLDPELLGARRFDTVVIDEACQCTEPSCWIPLLRAQRVVLAGDHCQLPPTILSQTAAREGFAVSLQERLVQLYGQRLSRPLLVQYRMHQDIMTFSSAAFYENRLVAHPSVARHRLADLPGVKEEEFTTAPVHFIDTAGGGYDEEKDPAGTSCRNPEEAALAAKKVRDLLACGVAPSDIALITPYAAQVQCLRDLLDNDAVEVGTVDGFQGREKEAVIISLVRSNKLREIGFLSDVRRMNVALTRARRKLIVIGDSATITAHSFYKRLLDHFDALGAYHVLWEET